MRKILLSEDSANDAELTLAALHDAHVADEVVHVRDGAEALDYLYRRDRYGHRPDKPLALIVLDLKMPKIDGLEVLRQVKANPHLRSTPVVILTSSREERDLARSYGLGVNAYVVKPVDFEPFVNAVKLLGAFWAVVNEPAPRTPD